MNTVEEYEEFRKIQEFKSWMIEIIFKETSGIYENLLNGIRSNKILDDMLNLSIDELIEAFGLHEANDVEFKLKYGFYLGAT